MTLTGWTTYPLIVIRIDADTLVLQIIAVSTEF